MQGNGYFKTAASGPMTTIPAGKEGTIRQRGVVVATGAVNGVVNGVGEHAVQGYLDARFVDVRTCTERCWK